MSKIVLVFSGFNERAIIAFLRTLEEENVKYAIIASSIDDPIFQTSYRSAVIATRSKRTLDLKDILEQIKVIKEKMPGERYVIAPSTEALNRFLVEHRNVFDRAGCDVPLVDKELYAAISDKLSFNKLCQDNGIRTPGQFASINEATIPFVAKPNAYVSKNGHTLSPVLIQTNEENNTFKNNYDIDDFHYQEFVQGDSAYLLYYFYQDGTVLKFSQQNYAQQPGGKSMVACKSANYHNDKFSESYERLFRSVNFWGLAMVEVRVGRGEPIMIECNPRFWGPSQLFVDAGINLFKAFLFDAGCIEEKPDDENYIVEARYFWYGGFIETITNGGNIVYHTISAEKFASEFAEWIASDVYNRKDSRGLFIQEAKLLS